VKIIKDSLVIRCVDFDTAKNDISYIRNKVFVEELNIPKELEWDNQDTTAHHYILSFEQHKILAYARLLPSGKLGRVAVLKQYRNQGLGSMLVLAICKKASKLGIKTINLSSQVSAVDFYTQLGFQISGDVFTEAGIKHRSMHKTLR
jgi:predicted GNAT family N-acyltransferase